MDEIPPALKCGRLIYSVIGEVQIMVNRLEKDMLVNSLIGGPEVLGVVGANDLYSAGGVCPQVSGAESIEHDDA